MQRPTHVFASLPLLLGAALAAGCAPPLADAAATDDNAGSALGGKVTTKAIRFSPTVTPRVIAPSLETMAGPVTSHIVRETDSERFVKGDLMPLGAGAIFHPSTNPVGLALSLGKDFELSQYPIPDDSELGLLLYYLDETDHTSWREFRCIGLGYPRAITYDIANVVFGSSPAGTYSLEDCGLTKPPTSLAFAVVPIAAQPSSASYTGYGHDEDLIGDGSTASP
jgi:hypothetical protein